MINKKKMSVAVVTFILSILVAWEGFRLQDFIGLNDNNTYQLFYFIPIKLADANIIVIVVWLVVAILALLSMVFVYQAFTTKNTSQS